jgi:1,4-dihydroxy-2-naphthoate octaprenyltransferase
MNTNLANDYFDHLSGADAGPSIGGSRVVQEGKITLGQLKTAILLLYFVAFLCGLWILWVSRVWSLGLLMVFAFFSSLFYTAGPVRYGYRGLGELFVGINMGPVMVVGACAALTGEYLARALWLSTPIGVMVAMILFYQSLPDIDEDRITGKRTIAVRVGKDRAIWIFRGFVFASIVSMAALWFAGLIGPAAIISLFTIPVAIKVDHMIRTFPNWKDLHDRGGWVRLFYLMNGLALILDLYLTG